MTRYPSPRSMLDLNLMFTSVLVLGCFHIPDGTRSQQPRPAKLMEHGGDFTFPDAGGPKHNFYYYHHNHRSGLHRDFPKASSGLGRIEPNISAHQIPIPLDVVYELNELDVDDILSIYVEGAEEINGAPIRQLTERFGDFEAKERKAGSVPPKAGCIPQPQAVKIAENDDPSILYIPQCTRIQRCGGCCSHTLLSCQPTETETVTYEVFKTQYVGGKKLKALGKEVVSIEKHTKCKCDCRVKPEDCSKFQEYKKSECRCACANFDEEQKCYKNSVRKLWNKDLCVCQCRETVQCSTGSYFDQNECKCKMAPARVAFP